MTLKDKAKTYNFWISLVSAAVLIARIIGNKFNVFIDTTLIMDITTGLCSIFVILGILSAPKSQSSETKTKQPIQNSQNTTTIDSLNQTPQDSVEENTNTELNILDKENIILNDTKQITDYIQTIETDKAKNVIVEIVEQLKGEINRVNKIIEEYSKE